MIKPGDYLEISYPITTHVRLIDLCKRKKRRLRIQKIRDLARYPLTIDEFLRRPFVARSRWLVLAWDLDIYEWRQFYLGSCDEFSTPGTMRIATYDEHRALPVEILSREFGPNVADRKAMIRFLRDYQEEFGDVLDLRICSDDLRIVG